MTWLERKISFIKMVDEVFPGSFVRNKRTGKWMRIKRALGEIK